MSGRYRPIAAGRISTKPPFARSIYYFVAAPQDQTQPLAGKGRRRDITTQLFEVTALLGNAVTSCIHAESVRIGAKLLGY
jgi:hypothetical protein